jgi:hypothetical protein
MEIAIELYFSIKLYVESIPSILLCITIPEPVRLEKPQLPSQIKLLHPHYNLFKE